MHQFPHPTVSHPTARGFTLIELLIVVAIIAILAAIAVPNFLEAQVRAKAARAKSDMRTLSNGLDQYHVDHNAYPDIFTRLTSITTPVQYLTSVPRDPFRLHQGSTQGRSWRQGWFRFGAMPIVNPSRYAIASVGPDTDIDTYLGGTGDNDDNPTSDEEWDASNQALRLYPGYNPALFSDNGWNPPDTTGNFKYILYDATNGTVSNGDLFRLSDNQAM